MKKTLYILSLIFLVTTFNCDDEPLEGDFITDADVLCQEATVNVSESALAFLNVESDNYNEICSAFRTALESQILACGDENGAIQQIIDQLGDCSAEIDTGNLCVNAIAVANEAELLFNNSTDANYTQLCNAFKQALQAVLDECGPVTDIQTQLDGLGDCVLTTTNPQTSGQITVTAGALDIIFDELTTEVVGSLLRITGETSATNNYTIYFEIESGAIGNDIINAEFRIGATSQFFPVTEGTMVFTSLITENSTESITGTFSGLVRNTDNSDLSLTSGIIDIQY